MGEGVARVRVNGARRRLTSRQVVRVAGVDALPVAFRRRTHHALRAEPANLAADIAAQLYARHEPSVRITEENHVGDAHLGGSRALLLTPGNRHLSTRDRAVRSARVAIGDDATGHLDTEPGPDGN